MTDNTIMARPRKYKSPAQMEKAIKQYLKITPEEEYTITGLAMHLGFTSRKDLINYEGYSKEYYHAIKAAKLAIENSYENALRRNGKAGEIFGLKNFGWRDRQELTGAGGTPLIPQVVDFENVKLPPKTKESDNDSE